MKIVKDCIYGHIEMPELCCLFIDTPEFQRLRRVKQLGNASRVYPSATHTRFEHSLGVAHLAGVLMDVLGRYPQHKRLVQLAGLYHDIGHLPYSHLFDKILHVARPDGVLLEHEDRSIETFLKVSKRLGVLSAEDEQFVCACILGKPLAGYDKCLFQVINSHIDVDKLDYLCRDAYHTGMPSFQANYIIRNARLTADKTIAFRKKAKEDIKDMFETRRRMHELVYQHPVSLEYDTLYMCMILKILNAQPKKSIETLCDYKLETALMCDPLTLQTYDNIERRYKNHSSQCDCSASVVKSIPDSGSIDDIEFVD